MLASPAETELVGWWRFDEGSGGIAADSSGNGLDGTIEGAIWTEGQSGSALAFDGSDDAVRIPAFTTGEAQTVAAWIKIDSVSSGQKQMFNGNGPPHMNLELADGMIEGRVYTGSTNITLTGPEVPVGEWAHVAWVYDYPGNRSELYIDGVSVAFGEAPSTVAHTSPSVIGRHPTATTASFLGVIDDVRIYDSALTEGEIISAMKGMPWPFAFGPHPKDGVMLEVAWVNLGWSAGDFAVSHDLYFGTSFEDVNDGGGGTFVGNLATTNQVVGFPGFPAPEGLRPGTTYYWRIDGVNDANAASPWKGDVWSFWIQPKTAYNSSPADGTINVLRDVRLRWAAGMGASLHQVYFGDNLDDVVSATGAVLQTDTTYTPSTLEVEKAYYWRVDEFDNTGATHRGDIWSFTTVPDVAVTDPNLTLWLTLGEGEGATAVDWSGYGHHASFRGEPRWVDGYQGGALAFDGDDDATVASFDEEEWSAYSVALWAKADSIGQDEWSSVFANHVPNSAGFQLDVDGTSPGMYRYNGVNGGAVQIGLVTTNWVHIAVACNGVTTTLYYNGNVAATIGAADAVFNLFGVGINRGENEFFEGIIDDVRVYDKELTTEEIQQVMLGDTKLAGSPVPDSVALVDIRDISSLSWSKGDTAVSHDVYFGTDRDTVANADNSSPEFQGNQTATSLSLADLVEFGGGDYYWRIDEVEADWTVHAGTIWTFTVPDYLIVDNFESYDNIDPLPGEPGVNRIFDKWIDGFGTTTNGALVGNDLPPYAEQTVVHGGVQSMIYRYDNAGRTSEATLTLTKVDWTVEGVTKLSLWLRGDSANAADRIFVALNDTAVVYHDDPAATQSTGWKEWVIDLVTFGTDLTNVSSITIGVGTKNAPAPGGSTGTMYFDEITLIR